MCKKLAQIYDIMSTKVIIIRRTKYVKFTGYFSDHMVFQREKNILLWGESDEKNVTAVIDEKKVSSDVNNGRWEIELPPMAAGGPYELEVSDGVQTKKYTDIMIGEVWLAEVSPIWSLNFRTA